jgi:hypothetical protein
MDDRPAPDPRFADLEPCIDVFEDLAEEDGSRLLDWIRSGTLRPAMLSHAAEIAGDVPGADAVLLPLLEHDLAYVREGAVLGLARAAARILEAIDGVAELDEDPDLRRTATDVVDEFANAGGLPVSTRRVSVPGEDGP